MPERKHDFTATEIKAGLLVLVSGLVLVGFIAAIVGLRPPEELDVYYADFSNVGGLEQQAEVRFGGVLAGRVAGITPSPENQSMIRVAAALQPGYPVNKMSVATIEQIGLTNAKHLEISTGEAEAELLPPGSEVPAVTKSAGLVELPDISGVITRVETLLDDVTDFLGMEHAREREAMSEEEVVRITKLTAQLNETLEEGTGLVGDVREVVAEQQPHIEEILLKVKDIEDAARDMVVEINGIVTENRAPIRETIAGVNETIGGLQSTIGTLETELGELAESLQRVLADAEGLSGQAGAMVEHNRPIIEDTLLDLQETIRNLKTFSRIMADQPQAIIRGREVEGRR